ncbi:acyltransferase family protein [Aliikangiella coralliicola]|uniref:Acyltransferase n=1 Tax=Aliikangiella coralliicola TaxID=2592383 RepID=A0A545UHH4_9GAMM|nr:acyltransferase [Aliikangiella coralliicola]TQV88915.1 acyltransferase [Aliikangiella coralliicola]
MNPGLTSYRFFAFFAVFLFHYGVFEFGYMGVHAFFVLSGFLLTPILLEMKSNLSTRRYYINFYGRRALRIFPLYFSYLALISIVAYVAINIFDYDLNDRLGRTLEQLVYAATYTYNFFTISSAYEQTQTLTHFWSLAVEEQFYLIWPLLLMVVPKEKVKTVLLAIIALGPVIRGIAAVVAVQWPDIFNKYDMTAYTFTFSNFDAFAIGGLFAVYIQQIEWRWIIALAVVTFMIGIGSEYLMGEGIKVTALGFKPFMSDSYKYIWGFSLFSILFACLLVKIKNREVLPQILEHKVLVYLGSISYGLYVYHFPIMYFLKHELQSIPGMVNLGLIFFISILVASLSYELLEKRFLAKKDILFHR